MEPKEYLELSGQEQDYAISDMSIVDRAILMTKIDVFWQYQAAIRHLELLLKQVNYNDSEAKTVLKLWKAQNEAIFKCKDASE